MEKLILKKYDHNIKVGQECIDIKPNVTKDTLFVSGDKIIGFYINNILNYSKKANDLLEIANREFRSKNVPKSLMRRSSGLTWKEKEVMQYSTILGYVPPKPHMRRKFNSISQVHTHEKAKKFIKSMYILAYECEEIIKSIEPNLYYKQIELLKNIDRKFKISNMFTSSISNYNISANYHIDRANISDTVNVILIKKKDTIGGNTTTPDYNITVDSCENSMLVYPAWSSIHAVTPIRQLKETGYRNSLVFYPLKFINL